MNVEAGTGYSHAQGPVPHHRHQGEAAARQGAALPLRPVVQPRPSAGDAPAAERHLADRWQPPPDADIEAERADGRFEERVRAVIGDIPYEIDWVSTYRFHQRVVARLRGRPGALRRRRRALVAALRFPRHEQRNPGRGQPRVEDRVHPPRPVTPARSLLESYHVERYAAARENLRVTEATIRFMVPPNRLRRWFRRVLLSLSHTRSASPASTSTAAGWPSRTSTPTRRSCAPTCWRRPADGARSHRTSRGPRRG